MAPPSEERPASFSLRRLKAPLETAAGLEGWRRVQRALELAGPGFFLRWLGGGYAFYALVAAAAIWHIRRAKHPVRTGMASELALRYYAFFLCGVGGVWNAIGHSILADQVARSIGWSTGSPFQLELAAFHLGLAVVALATPWLTYHATATVVVAKGVFLLGAASVHVRDLVRLGNVSPGNAGFATLWFGDLFVPCFTLWLVWRVGRSSVAME